MLNPESNALWLNLVLLGGASLLIWGAGTKLSEYADEIAARTGLGQAFVGLFLLAGATSLPEVATTVTASANGDVDLAANNLLGGIAMQTAILAIADFVAIRGSLTFFTPRPVLLLQGIFVIALLSIALAGAAVGELASVGRIGLWPVLLFTGYVLTLQQTKRYQGRPRWTAQTSEQEQETLRLTSERRNKQQRAQREKGAQLTSRRLYLFFAVASLVVLAGGWSVAMLGGALAEQTGLGGSFVGATLVAVTTSLPEVSTTVRSAQLGNYAMAVSNIFGSNAFMLALFLVAEITYSGTVMDSLDRASQFTAAIGIAVTCVYLWGLLERRDKTVFRMGVDSAIVVCVYLAGVAALYVTSTS